MSISELNERCKQGYKPTTEERRALVAQHDGPLTQAQAEELGKLYGVSTKTIYEDRQHPPAAEEDPLERMQRQHEENVRLITESMEKAKPGSAVYVQHVDVLADMQMKFNKAYAEAVAAAPKKRRRYEFLVLHGADDIPEVIDVEEDTARQYSHFFIDPAACTQLQFQGVFLVPFSSASAEERQHLANLAGVKLAWKK